MIEEKCYVIAEIGNNHCGDIDLWIKTIEEAKVCGASAVKLQKRFNKELLTEDFYNSPYENPNSYGHTYGEHRDYLELSDSEMIKARKCAKEIDIDFICTPFDNSSVEFLAKNLDLDAWKIASADLRNREIQDKIINSSQGNKPIIISSGGYTFNDVKNTCDYLKPKFKEIVALHCISSYPANPQIVNLSCVKSLSEILDSDIKVGYSSHDNGIALSLASRVMGARVIEKHFTLDRSLKGTDHPMSANPTMLRKLVKDLEKIDQSFGNGKKIRLEEEKPPLIKMIKSPYAARKICKGEILKKEDIIYKVPFTGLDYEDSKVIIGKCINKDLNFEDEINLEDLI